MNQILTAETLTRTRPTSSTTSTPTSPKDNKTYHPRSKRIISKGIGIYATAVLQPTTLVARLTTGLTIHAYLPMNRVRYHNMSYTTYRASSHGELGSMANTITRLAAKLPAHLPHTVRVWFVVDATVDTHLLLRRARQPLKKATATKLGTEALIFWKALRGLPPYAQLHMVKQESHRHQYRRGRVDRQCTNSLRNWRPFR